MKKKILLFTLLLALLVGCATLAGCKKVKEIVLDRESLTLNLDDVTVVEATISPEKAKDTPIHWVSSNTAVATVENGKITAVGVGTATVTASADKASATLSVTVVDPTVYVTGVTLSDTTLDLPMGEIATLTASVLPANATNAAVKWESSDPAVVRVHNGTLTPVSVGTATVTVTTLDGGKRASCTVHVYIPTVSVTGISLSRENATLVLGTQLSLSYTVSPENADDKSVVWSVADPTVATVENGTITAVGVGTTTVTVTTVDGGKSASCTVRVEPVRVSTITVTPDSLSLLIGESGELTATVTPANATDPTLVWSSSDESVVTVQNGRVLAIGAGTANVTVKNEASGVSTTVPVTVTDLTVYVTGVTLSKNEIYLVLGATETVSATVTPADATNPAVIWSVENSDIATVNGGLITAVAFGTTTVTVTTVDGAHTATLTVTVYDPTVYVERVELNTGAASVNLGDTLTLVHTIYPENAGNKSVRWSSSDESVLTVKDGVITPVGVGTATVTVTTEDGNKTASAIITVSKITINVVTVHAPSTSVLLGRELTLTASFSPSDAYDPTLIWSSSDENVLTVADGKIITKAPGTATVTVTAKDGGAYATVEITVLPEKLAYAVNPDGVTATVTGIGSVTGSEIVIPDTIDGYVVTAIDADAFFGATITSLTLPNTVVEIGSNAFYGCMRLSSVTLGTSLRTIREGAFRGCIELYSITLPASLASIETDAFYGCRKLVEVYDLTTDLAVTRASTDNGSVGRYAHAIHRTAASASILSVRDGFVVMSVTGGRYLLGYVGSSVALVLPDTIEEESYEIYHDAFIGRSDITSVTLTRGVTAIGTNAFCDCTSLTEITLYPELLSIGEDAFLGCYALATVYDLTDHLLVGKNSDNGSVGRYAEIIYNTI